ncbi:GlxA family transcriptional regulator [Aestuariivita boseongensis]|uniref:GlxA family transcriptional regulator n=1 Tax=Aestuariivita boseongensis TaxID=1470562 RepID=UPI000682FEA0|nr:GlxA family transcriptional regulator [Aestuariivita boseongensis]
MAGGQDPKRYVFLLLPGYSLIGFSAALEALSLANRHPSGRTHYSWRILSEDGQPVPAYNGITVTADSGLTDLARDETLIVCAGENVGAVSTPRVLSWLRRETKRGGDYGALSSGAYTLALAGLIRGKRVTTHWEYRNALSELLPDVIVQDSIYAVDGRVFTTAGGAASMDLMLYRVHADYGPDVANWVADQMVYTDPREESHAQRRSLTGSGVRNSKLALILQIMENNIEDPLTPDEIAEVVGLSSRQIERLFNKYLNTSPKRYYLQMRLDKARDLLRQTSLPITEISVACGFRSSSHFSKCYRSSFGVSPSQEGAQNRLAWPPTQAPGRVQ